MNKFVFGLIVLLASAAWAKESPIVSCTSTETGAEAKSSADVMVDEDSGNLTLQLYRSSKQSHETYAVTCSNCSSDEASRVLIYSGSGVSLTVMRTETEADGGLKSYFESQPGGIAFSCELIEN